LHSRRNRARLSGGTATGRFPAILDRKAENGDESPHGEQNILDGGFQKCLKRKPGQGNRLNEWNGSKATEHFTVRLITEKCRISLIEHGANIDGFTIFWSYTPEPAVVEIEWK
jgi:hypothetical protein